MAIEDAKSANLFLWAQVGKSNLNLSHLFYADDAIFIIA